MPAGGIGGAPGGPRKPDLQSYKNPVKRSHQAPIPPFMKKRLEAARMAAKPARLTSPSGMKAEGSMTGISKKRLPPLPPIPVKATVAFVDVSLDDGPRVTPQKEKASSGKQEAVSSKFEAPDMDDLFAESKELMEQSVEKKVSAEASEVAETVAEEGFEEIDLGEGGDEVGGTDVDAQEAALTEEKPKTMSAKALAMMGGKEDISLHAAWDAKAPVKAESAKLEGTKMRSEYVPITAQVAKENKGAAGAAMFAYHSSTGALMAESQSQGRKTVSMRSLGLRSVEAKTLNTLLENKSELEDHSLDGVQVMGKGQSACIVDPKTGLRATLVKENKPDGKYILSFAGMAGGKKGESPKRKFMNQLRTAIAQFFGIVPKAHKQAAAFAKLVKDDFGQENVVVSGHSLGGGLAEYAGLKHGLATVSINGAPLGRGLQKDLNKGDLINANAGKVVHMDTQGDWLTDKGVGRGIRRFSEWREKKKQTTAKSFGTKYLMPAPRLAKRSIGRGEGIVLVGREDPNQEQGLMKVGVAARHGFALEAVVQAANADE